MTDERPRVIAVRHGDVVPTGSWLYAWIDTADGDVAYVGATGFDPELRAHLHLHHEDPAIARVRTLVPNAEDRDFDVLVFPLPAGAARPPHKQAVKRALLHAGLLKRAFDDDPVGDIDDVLVAEIVATVAKYVSRITGTIDQ